MACKNRRRVAGSPRWTDAASGALALALGAAALASAPARAAEAPESAPAARPADFATPAPGSYALPPLGAAADGDVLSSAGVPVRLHDLFGADAVLLSFIYTRCTNGEGCPLATAVLQRVGARLAREPEVAARMRLLSLSFDPKHDTPDVMRRYGEGLRRDGLDWHFLTGASDDALAPLLAAYRQTRVPEVDADGAPTGGFAHLVRVFLIDGAKRIRQVYSAALLEPEALVADVKTVLLESRTTTSGATTGGAAANGGAPHHRSGDLRAGYDGADFATRSQPLAARRGRAANLLERVERAPLGLPAVPLPADNPISSERIALGRRLFFDRRLSHNDTISCALCHVPEQGFASNEMATAVGIEGHSVRRNAPSLYNSAYLTRLFHDGRETRLEHQVWGPLLAANEMGNPSIGALLEKLENLDDYAAGFDAAFPGEGLSMSTLGMALASYERTLVSGDSPFDRTLYGGETAALSPSARRGFALFSGAAGCAGCHTMDDGFALFTDGAFHNTGVGYRAAMGATVEAPQRVQAAPGVILEVPRAIVEKVSAPVAPDLGRYEITRDPNDRWRYRTPTLRNVALSAPYMHDGSLATLRDVVAFYRRGGVPNENLDPLVHPLALSESDVDDLVAFLEALTGSDVDVLVADAFAAPVGDVGR